jgi:hypothetical protein
MNPNRRSSPSYISCIINCHCITLPVICRCASNKESITLCICNCYCSACNSYLNPNHNQFPAVVLAGKAFVIVVADELVCIGGLKKWEFSCNVSTTSWKEMNRVRAVESNPVSSTDNSN